MSDEQLFGEGFNAHSVEDLDNSGTREVQTCSKILKRLLTGEQLKKVFPIAGNKSHLAGTGNELLLTYDLLENCFAHYTPDDSASYRNLASWQFLKTVTQEQFVEMLDLAEARGKPGLFDIFMGKREGQGKEEENSEEDDEAEENDAGDEENDAGDEKLEMEIDCAQAAPADPETKYTTFATNNG